MMKGYSVNHIKYQVVIDFKQIPQNIFLSIKKKDKHIIKNFKLEKINQKYYKREKIHKIKEISSIKFLNNGIKLEFLRKTDGERLENVNITLNKLN